MIIFKLLFFFSGKNQPIFYFVRRLYIHIHCFVFGKCFAIVSFFVFHFSFHKKMGIFLRSGAAMT